MNQILSHLPDGWINSEYFPTIENQSPIRHVIPFGSEHPQKKSLFIYSFVLECSGNVHLVGNYDTTEGWETLYSFSPRHSPIYSSGPIWNRSLWCIGEDANKLQKLEEILHSHIERQFGGIPIPSEKKMKRVRQMMERKQKRCNCNTSNSLPNTKTATEESELFGCTHVFCNQCLRHHAIRIDGKKIPDSTLFDPDWILGETVKDIIEVPETDNYIIYKTSDEVKRIDYTVEALAWRGEAQYREYTSYDPEIQDVLIYIHDGAVAGYMSVRKLREYDILHQIYIRDSMRGNGYGTNLIESWSENIRETDMYLLDAPNEASNSIIRRLGHLDRSSFPRALPASRIESLYLHN